MNRDVLVVALGFFLDPSHARNLDAGCRFVASSARVSRVFAQAARVHLNRIQLLVRFCRVLEFQNASKTTIARLFGKYADVFFPDKNLPPKTRQVVPLIPFAHRFLARTGPEEALSLIAGIEDRPRRKRMLEERREEKRAFKRQRALELTDEATAALKARQLPVELAHPALQKYCNGTYKTMTHVYRAMKKLQTEQNLLAAFRALQEPELAELRAMTPEERRARFEAVCAEHKQRFLLFDPVVRGAIDGTAIEPTGFICALLFLRDAADHHKYYQICKSNSFKTDVTLPFWRNLAVRAALCALDKDFKLPSLAHAWMISARVLAKKLK